MRSIEISPKNEQNVFSIIGCSVVGWNKCLKLRASISLMFYGVN